MLKVNYTEFKISGNKLHTDPWRGRKTGEPSENPKDQGRSTALTPPTCGDPIHVLTGLVVGKQMETGVFVTVMLSG